MRIDLMHGGTRPWWLRLALGLLERGLGVVPGPIQVLTYRLEQIAPPLRMYMARGMAGCGAYTKTEAELLAAFVSNRNTCHF